MEIIKDIYGDDQDGNRGIETIDYVFEKKELKEIAKDTFDDFIQGLKYDSEIDVNYENIDVKVLVEDLMPFYINETMNNIDKLENEDINMILKNYNKFFTEYDLNILKNNLKNKNKILDNNNILINGKKIKIPDSFDFEKNDIGYRIENVSEIIDNLIGWINDNNQSNHPNKITNDFLMKNDLNELMNSSEDFCFSSYMTNEYIFSDDIEEYDDILNNIKQTLSNLKKKDLNHIKEIKDI